MNVFLSAYNIAQVQYCNELMLISPYHIDGLMQDCSNSSGLTMELLQSCTNPLIYAPSNCDNMKLKIPLTLNFFISTSWLCESSSCRVFQNMDELFNTLRLRQDSCCFQIQIQIQIHVTLLSPNIHIPLYTNTPIDYINIYINNSMNISNVMGAKGAGNPVGFMGSLSDTLKYHLSQQGCKDAGDATVTTQFVSNTQHIAL